MTKTNKWYKLDNAAKIFPPTTTYYDPKIFRFSVILKDEVNQTQLKQALDETLNDFPIFKSVLKKGLFWYYLEESNIDATIGEETNSPCEKLNTSLLFEVTTYKTKINLEVYHALSDGTGCITFFKNLIYNYLCIHYKIEKKDTLTTSSDFEKESNSFEKYYNPKRKIRVSNRKNSYVLKGPWYPEGKLNITTGVVSTKELIKLAKEHNTTITCLLASIIIKSLENIMSVKDKKKQVSITVPIDLRKFYKSDTVRNFFNVTNITYQFSKKVESLDDIISSVNNQMKKSLEPDVISNQMNKMIWLEKFFIVRLIPLVIKNIVLKYSYKKTRLKQTLGLSNVGIISVPKEVEKYIEKFIVFNSTDALELCVCSYLDELSLSFTSHFISNEIENNFFRTLKEFGINIEIYSNELNGGEENE